MAKTVNVNEIVIYDGSSKRCCLDEATMLCEYDTNADTTISTNLNGVFESGPDPVPDGTATVKLTVSKTRYKTTAVTAKISWNGDVGTVGVKSINLTKR